MQPVRRAPPRRWGRSRRPFPRGTGVLLRAGALPLLLLLPLLSACGGAAPARRESLRGTMLPSALPRPDFTLLDTRGEPYAFRARTRGRLTLLYFGYTHCPDVCPVQMGNVAAVLDRMPPEVVRRTSVVFVTVDPARDTPARLRAWLDHFPTRFVRFVGLRGTEAQVGAIERALGVAVAVRDSGAAGRGAGAYGVGHAAQLLAFTPDDSAHVAYPFGTLQSDLAHDLPRLLATYPGADPRAASIPRAGADSAEHPRGPRGAP